VTRAPRDQANDGARAMPAALAAVPALTPNDRTSPPPERVRTK
jgi:hypothetical protein